MKVDYIIVGSGLAGILFCEVLKRNSKSFIVIDDASQQSSAVAGGLYNPVVLKRFTAVWKAKEQLDMALPMYRQLEKDLNERLQFELPVYRLFTSTQEQNNWFQSCDKTNLKMFLSSELITTKFDSIESPFGFGEVLNTGRIDTAKLLNVYKKNLKERNSLIEDTFRYSDLKMTTNGVAYAGIDAKQIVFAEGFGLKNNPYFKHLPLKGAKGELITIHAKDLTIEFVLKSGVFIIPIGNNLFRVGSTYEWLDKTNTITAKGKDVLITKLKMVLKCDFEVVDQVAGMRPTVIDRRPLVGQHVERENLYVLNGLGTRGVMIAPYVAHQLFNLIEHEKPLDNEISISRFN